ncbi:DUF6101 family protein [Enterovirga rhinocerotis]|uniref:Uncharacterized protein n=1 Tax=Enterovirga rhinocerotis TaxID=1339210 RepID=A0A4R7C6X1_9HYPH|nr:DUF6101 family protein [Enterovirga rhinocerotis]TDR93893.1 hypothetical protein EV668_1162 [Enterovirga rhinocerotis]
MVCDGIRLAEDDRSFEASPLPVMDAQGSVPGAGRPVGLALEFEEGRFAIHISGPDDEPLVTLGLYDHEDVIAVWRAMAASSGLPLLLPGPDGRLQQPYPQIGRLVVGACIERRRLGVLSGRRPRFLARRKSSRLPRRPLVHRNTEIVEGRAL